MLVLFKADFKNRDLLMSIRKYGPLLNVAFSKLSNLITYH